MCDVAPSCGRMGRKQSGGVRGWEGNIPNVGLGEEHCMMGDCERKHYMYIHRRLRFGKLTINRVFYEENIYCMLAL